IIITDGDLPSVLQEASIAGTPLVGQLAALLFPGHRCPRGLPRLKTFFPTAPEACYGANFVFQSASQSELGRSAVRFATRKFIRHPQSRLVAWHANSVTASLLRLDQETGDAKRHRQVVQPDKGLWVHQADGRR